MVNSITFYGKDFKKIRSLAAKTFEQEPNHGKTTFFDIPKESK